MVMRGRFPYVVLLAGALVALIGSAAWAATHEGGRSWPPGPSSRGQAACTPPHLAGTIVGVQLMGMGRGPMMGGSMMGGGGMMRLLLDRTNTPTGRISLVARNLGGAVHELVVLPLTAGHSAGARTIGADNRVSEAGSLGEASRSCGPGTGNGIAPGTTGWVTLHLKPGHYEIVCNLPGHYRAGMYAELDVS
jgi:hypothetical protein